MGQLRLNLLVIFLIRLSPVLSFEGAEEPPPPGEGICYKVFYEATFNELIKLSLKITPVRFHPALQVP